MRQSHRPRRAQTTLASRAPRLRLGIEQLEDRRLMAATDLAELFPPRPDLLPDSAWVKRDHDDHDGLHEWHLLDGQWHEMAALPLESPLAETIEAPLTQSMALHPLSNIPALNSLPGAPATLYLDFDGHFQATYGIYSNIVTSVFDSDGDATTFSDTELDYIATLWSDVAEDFAPFNINVTTVEPAVLAPGVTESAANGLAVRVAIGQSTGENGFVGTSGGWAYFNVFTNSIANVVYAFATPTSTPISYASIASHEAGHAFGLQHQTGAYYDFQTRQSALMGPAIFGFEHTYWHNGLTDSGATQDDMAQIARSANGFGYRADDHGNSIAAATPLTSAGSGFTASGIVGSNTDVDVFSLTLATPGSFLISLEGHSPGQNLDGVIELLDASGAVLLTANPGDSLDASMFGRITGTGYIAVRSTGQYGRIGQYTLNLTPTSPGVFVETAHTVHTTSESGRSEAFSLALSARPAADVTFLVESDNTLEGVVSAGSVIFTPDNWFQPQTVTVTGVADGIADGAAGYTVSISPAISADPAYHGVVDPVDLSFVNLDETIGHVYWMSVDTSTDMALIERATLTGDGVQTVVDVVSTFGDPGSAASYSPYSIAVDTVTAKIYWTDITNGAIRRTNRDGSAPETLLTGLPQPAGIAIDAAAGKMYWVDWSLGAIQRANLDGSGVETIVSSGLNSPSQLMLDVEADKMYWSESGTDVIQRANLDGSGVETVVPRDGVSQVNAFTLDAAAGKLYFALRDSTTTVNGIYRSDLDGANREFLIDAAAIVPTFAGNVVGMAIDAASERLYWVTNRDRVFSANLDGSLVAGIADVAGPVARGLAILPAIPGVSVFPQGSLVTTEAGGTAAFSVVLEAPPTAEVTFPVASSDPTEGIVSVSSLTFTPANWNVPQLVLITGVDELLDDGDVAYTIVLGPAISADPAYQGLDASDVTVTNLDDDAPLFADSFEIGEWNGLWVEDSQDDWFRSTQRATDGLRSAEVDGSAANATLTMAQGIDLTPYASAELSFSWYIESSLDANEYVAVDVFNGAWREVARLRGNVDQENVWHHETIVLAGADMVSGFKVRFRGNMSSADEDANVDNVRISATSLAAPNQSPTATAGGPYAVNEGSSVTLSAAGSVDPDGTILSYDWDLDGDGQYDDATGVTPIFSTSQDGAYVVGLRVTDDRGATSTATATVTVANVAPTAHAGGPYAGYVDQAVVLSAAGSSDPGNDISSYAWDLDGDGQFDDAIGASVVFTATSPASYAVSVRVTDDDGASSTASATVAISEVPTEVVLFQDSFESGQWNGRWVQDSQNDWFTSTQRKTHGNYSAEVDGLANNATLTMSTPIDLSGYASATLTFDWLIEKGFDSGEYLALDVFNGTTWINDVRRLNGDVDAEDIWHAESVDLAAFSSTSLRIRFRSTVSDAKEDANVDNVRIVGRGGGSLAAISLGNGPATVAQTPTRLGTTRSTGTRETDFVPTTSVGTIVEMMAKASRTNFLPTRRAVVDAAFAEFGSSVDGPRFAAASESQFRRDLW